MPSRLIRHALIHVFLTLCFLLPGGLLWNRVEPHLAGLPFSVFVETLLLPFLIALNLVGLFWAFWRHDQSTMRQLRQGNAITGAPETDQNKDK